MRLIDTDALEKYITDIIPQETFSPYGKGVLDILTHLKNRIRTEMPSVDAEPGRHGRWIPTEYDGYADGYPVYDAFECSECGHEHSGEEDTLTAFCPDCGAMMNGGADDGGMED